MDEVLKGGGRGSFVVVAQEAKAVVRPLASLSRAVAWCVAAATRTCCAVSCFSNAQICCRCRPDQKAAVVNLVKTTLPDARTLAIGACPLQTTR